MAPKGSNRGTGRARGTPSSASPAVDYVYTRTPSRQGTMPSQPATPATRNQQEAPGTSRTARRRPTVDQIDDPEVLLRRGRRTSRVSRVKIRAADIGAHTQRAEGSHGLPTVDMEKDKQDPRPAQLVSGEAETEEVAGDHADVPVNSIEADMVIDEDSNDVWNRDESPPYPFQRLTTFEERCTYPMAPRELALVGGTFGGAHTSPSTGSSGWGLFNEPLVRGSGRPHERPLVQSCRGNGSSSKRSNNRSRHFMPPGRGSSSSVGEPTSRSRRYLTPPGRRNGSSARSPAWYFTPPSADPDPNRDVEGKAIQPIPPLSFWRIFRDQICAGMRYLRQRQTLLAFLLSFVLLLQPGLCSAGPACVDQCFWKVFWLYLSQCPVEFCCTLTLWTLLISGFWDVLVGCATVLERSGRRTAQQLLVVIPNWKAFRARDYSFVRAYLLPMVTDAINHVLDPASMLVLTTALRHSWLDFCFGDWQPSDSDVTLSVGVSLTLHSMKWLVQAVEIYRERRGLWRGPRVFNRPLVTFLLLVLGVGAIFHHRELLAFSPFDDLRAAQAYWNSDLGRTGNETRLNLASWVTAGGRTAATRAYAGTHMLGPGAVRPTTTSNLV